MKYKNLNSFNKRFSPNWPTGPIQSTIRHVRQSMPSQNSYFQRTKMLTPFFDTDDKIFKKDDFF